MRIHLTHLSSGWLRIQCGRDWAQVPPGFDADEIPAEYLFQPDWDHTRLQAAWRRIRPTHSAVAP